MLKAFRNSFSSFESLRIPWFPLIISIWRMNHAQENKEALHYKKFLICLKYFTEKNHFVIIRLKDYENGFMNYLFQRNPTNTTIDIICSLRYYFSITNSNQRTAQYHLLSYIKLTQTELRSKSWVGSTALLLTITVKTAVILILSIPNFGSGMLVLVTVIFSSKSFFNFSK